jgi:hypothetical protein
MGTIIGCEAQNIAPSMSPIAGSEMICEINRYLFRGAVKARLKLLRAARDDGQGRAAGG